MHEGDEDHVHLDDGTFAYVGERIELKSVGIDIGSSTSHLVFSGLVLERQGKRLSSRYVVTVREILNRSPVIFTPFAPSGQIDAPALGRFIAEAYGAAGFTPDEVDGGAVSQPARPRCGRMPVQLLSYSARKAGSLSAPRQGRIWK